ncbi:hypothetical protein [Streptomyces sp. CA-253872]|uniref:hypothetical protein n=1 Tax=Streptomyces sp. CA-253872 TaxID=3240067 RepID=UPI003D918E92
MRSTSGRTSPSITGSPAAPRSPAAPLPRVDVVASPVLYRRTAVVAVPLIPVTPVRGRSCPGAGHPRTGV